MPGERCPAGAGRRGAGTPSSPARAGRRSAIRPPSPLEQAARTPVRTYRRRARGGNARPWRSRGRGVGENSTGGCGCGLVTHGPVVSGPACEGCSGRPGCPGCRVVRVGLPHGPVVGAAVPEGMPGSAGAGAGWALPAVAGGPGAVRRRVPGCRGCPGAEAGRRGGAVTPAGGVGVPLSGRASRAPVTGHTGRTGACRLAALVGGPRRCRALFGAVPRCPVLCDVPRVYARRAVVTPARPYR